MTYTPGTLAPRLQDVYDKNVFRFFCASASGKQHFIILCIIQQKIVAFENAFDRLLEIITEEGCSDGGEWFLIRKRTKKKKERDDIQVSIKTKSQWQCWKSFNLLL